MLFSKWKDFPEVNSGRYYNKCYSGIGRISLRPIQITNPDIVIPELEGFNW